MKKICFIDDREDELQLFKDAFSDSFEIVAQGSFEECAKEFLQRKWKKPDLFVLDLYFPKGPPDRGTLKALGSMPVEFIHDDADIEKAMRNYDQANQRLEAVLHAHRQSPEGGIDLARLVRRHFARLPIVFYSRNPTSDDYLRCMREPKVSDLIPKLPWPHGKSTQENRSLAREASGPTADRFLRAIDPPKDLELLKKAIEIVWRATRALWPTPP